MGHVHVRDKSTGHEYPVAEHLFNPDAHEKTGKPVRDAHGDLVQPKFRTPLGTPTKQAARKASESGQKAEPEKE